MNELDLEVPDVHPLYRDPVQGWTCLRHGGCAPAVALRNVDQWHMTFPPSGPTRVTQHTCACDRLQSPQEPRVLPQLPPTPERGYAIDTSPGNDKEQPAMSDPHGYISVDGPLPVGCDLTPQQAAGIESPPAGPDPQEAP